MMAFLERLFKHKLLLGVLAILFVLSLFGNCVLSLKYTGFFSDASTTGLVSDNSQNEFFNNEKGEIAFFAFSAAQTQQQDSNLKTKKSVSHKNQKSSFRRSQYKVDKINIINNFISISHSRFRRTCPSEDAIS